MLGLRVLVVDADADTASMLAEGLSLYGFETRFATDDASALVIAAEWKPAVGVIDRPFAKGDRRELARELRELPGLDEARLIAMASWPLTDGEALAAGFDGYLMKPAWFADIVERIKMFFEQ